MEHTQMAQRETSQAGQVARQFFSDLVAAKEEYNDACKEYSRASVRRDKAHQRLMELAQQANDGLQCIMDDPTAPKAMPDCIANGASKSPLNDESSPLRKW